MWLAPKVFLSNQVDNKILAIITKPSKLLERAQTEALDLWHWKNPKSILQPQAKLLNTAVHLLDWY